MERVIFSLCCPCGLQWVRAEAGTGPGQPSQVLWPSLCPCQAPRTDLFGAGVVSALCLAEVAEPPQVWEGQVLRVSLRPSPPTPQEDPSMERGCVWMGGSSAWLRTCGPGQVFPDWVSACASCPPGRPRPQPGPEVLL